MPGLAYKIGEKIRPTLKLWTVFLNHLITGSLLFCPDCGTLLDLPKGDQEAVKCEQCDHHEPISCTDSNTTLVNTRD